MAGKEDQGGGRGRNPTVVRPSPGGSAGIRPGSASPPPPAEVRLPEGNRGSAAHAISGAPAAAATAGPDVAVREFVARSDNPILSAAGPLLSLGVAIGASAYQADIEALRARAIDAVKAFEEQCRQFAVDAAHVRIARFIVCTFVDTAVFQTPWGGHHVWGSRSLLVLFEQEAGGGVKFFTMLTELSKAPDRYLDVLELQYVCLALGFMGMYREQPDGQAQVQSKQDALYRLIRDRRAGLGAVLATHWKGLAEPKAKAFRIIPWWVALVAAVVVVLGTLIVARAWLSDAAAPTAKLLATRGLLIDYQPVPAPVVPSRLKTLLAPQERAGDLTVEEFGKRTVVTLRAPELFQSGSARVAAGHEALFDSIGRALEAVPGRIMIIGHTDDQPLRSFKYADNIELSRARAIAVAELIKPGISNASRIEWSGVGSTQPRFQPASLPENRARNRRVEIEHFAE
jgi:type VI secretion system protein ImpK